MKEKEFKKYKIGTKVSHHNWGKGTVVECYPKGFFHTLVKFKKRTGGSFCNGFGWGFDDYGTEALGTIGNVRDLKVIKG